MSFSSLSSTAGSFPRLFAGLTIVLVVSHDRIYFCVFTGQAAETILIADDLWISQQRAEFFIALDKLF